MSIKAQHNEDQSFYFCTFTCNRWMNLFDQTNSYDKIYEWFDILFEMKMIISAFVIMPNHCHFILFYNNQKISLNKIIGNGKRFLAYEIVSRLKKQEAFATLRILEEDVIPSDKKKGKIHNVFRYSFDAKLIYSNKMMQEKIIYIHNNPISKKWKLANTPEEYQHSSALFYETGKTNFKWLKHFRDV